MTQTALYRHFGADGRLLYVGCSVRPVRRSEAHMGKAAWAGQISRIEIERFPTKREALDAELAAIEGEAPLHNGRHKPGRGVPKGTVRGKYNNPAGRVISMFGGAKTVAEAVGITMPNVRRWQYPEDRCGLNGVIPAKYHETLIAEARRRGIDLRPEHFFAGTAA